MSSGIVLVNNPQLAPETECYVPVLNSDGQKMLFPVNPLNTATYSPGNNTRVEFDIVSNNAVLLRQECYLEFDVAISSGVTSTPTATISGDASCFFSQVQNSTIGGFLIEDSYPQGAALKNRILHDCLISDTRKRALWAQGMNNLGQQDSVLLSVTTNNALLTPTPTHFAIPVPSQFWDEPQAAMLPISGGYKMVMFIATAQNALYQASDSTVTYTITNLRLQTVVQPLAQDYLKDILAAAEQQLVLMKFDYAFYLPNNGSATANNSIQVQKGMRWINSAIIVQRDATSVGSFNYDSIGNFLNPAGGLNQLQIQAGSRRWPLTAISNATQAYVELLKVLGIYHHNDAGNQLTLQNYTKTGPPAVGQANQGANGVAGVNGGPRTVYGIDMSVDNGASSLGGYDSNGQYITVQLNTNSTPAPANIYNDIFLFAGAVFVPLNKQANVLYA